jgi:hypothetical protein
LGRIAQCQECATQKLKVCGFSFSSQKWPAGVCQFLPAGNSYVENEILFRQTDNSSLPPRWLAAIVLAYSVENCVWVTARSASNWVKVQGGG